MSKRNFCTAINCMDGRVQISVLEYLFKRFDADYVDTITEPGPNLILSELKEENIIESIIKRIKISVGKHGSKGIAIVGHHDCAGNPCGKDGQLKHLQESVNFISSKFNIPVIALWVDENWQVKEIDFNSKEFWERCNNV